MNNNRTMATSNPSLTKRLCLIVFILFHAVNGFIQQSSRSKTTRIQASPLQAKTREDDELRKNVQTVMTNTISSDASQIPSSRRLFFASSLFSAGALMAGKSAEAAEMTMIPSSSLSTSSSQSLLWVKDPINPKRSSIRVSDAENLGYNLSFVTYLSRFLLSFDPVAQAWWINKAQEIQRAGGANAFAIRQRHFGEFSASVELGLQGFGGEDGPARLMDQLVSRYTMTASNNVNKLGKREKREMAEARRQIALLFGLLGENQPTQQITRLLAAIDNGSVSKVNMLSTTSNEAGGLTGFGSDETPQIVFPPPSAGLDGYETAVGKAILEPTGQILRLQVLDGGQGFTKNSPKIILSPPRAAGGEAATAVANVKNGKIESIKITNPGAGYTLEDIIKVTIDHAASSTQILPILDMQLTGVKVVTGGSGYAVEKPVRVEVQKKSGEKILIGSGETMGQPQSFTAFRSPSENQVRVFERDLFSSSTTAIGTEDSFRSMPFATKASSSQQLLALLPKGYGLEYDMEKKRYFLAVDKETSEKFPGLTVKSTESPSRALVPDFGPRGLAPIERKADLDLSTFFRFSIAGAICSSAVHVALTPLEVVKTKVQTTPTMYPKVLPAFGILAKEEGPTAFFSGWIPTLLGWFGGGAVLYATTEVIRRTLTDLAGANADSLEVPIILAAAAVASAATVTIVCPFDAVRIRQVANPSYGKNAPAVAKRMISEEGIGSLIDALPVFLARQVPYAMVKFTIFDLSTEYLMKAYPSSSEDLILSLGISLLGGIFGGVSAAIVSNPADAVISELKKAASDMSPQEAFRSLMDRTGASGLFKGLQIRMLFYSLASSMQFVTYDSIRFALGVTNDDLKLYLDVLDGALASTGTIA